MKTLLGFHLNYDYKKIFRNMYNNFILFPKIIKIPFIFGHMINFLFVN